MKKTTFYLSIIAFLILSTTAISQRAEVADGTLPNVNVIQDANAPSVSNTLRTPAALLFDNGPHFNVPGNPPTTAHRSVLENTTLGLNTLGGGASGDFRIADDFTLTDESNIPK